MLYRPKAATDRSLPVVDPQGRLDRVNHAFDRGPLSAQGMTLGRLCGPGWTRYIKWSNPQRPMGSRDQKGSPRRAPIRPPHQASAAATRSGTVGRAAESGN